MKVYLAGAMEFAQNNGAQWRELAIKLLSLIPGATYFNPCTDEFKILSKYGYENAKEFHADKSTDPESHWTKCMQEIAKTDLVQVASSDYVLVYITPNLSGGTVGEITCAKYIYDVPVIAVWHPEADERSISGWIQAACDQNFTKFTEAINYMEQQRFVDEK